MGRKKKLIYNTITSLLHQIVGMVCAFVLPRYFLTTYGSQVNGLVSSVTQFLGFITLAECGVGAVVQSTLYKPLAEKNEDEISRIIISAEKFFRHVALLLLVYVGILMVVYPNVVRDSFDYFYTASLIAIISMSSFIQYYFSMSYRILLNADQLAFIQLGLQTITLILNTICSVVLMKKGAGIQFVKLASALIFLIQPLALNCYVKRHYRLNRKLKLTEEPIKQKWNGMAQHIAAVVLGNTDTVVLTLFSTLQNVSVYAVYYLVVNGVKQIVMSLTEGMQSMLGNMYVRKETETLNRIFAQLEWMLHTVTIFTFGCTGILIVPFVKVYTMNVVDADYIVPAFAVLLCAAQAAYCLRRPYNMMVLAAGHYRQTQTSAIIEVVINIVLSVALVVKFGLIGVAIGTLAAMLYRTIYLAWYLSGNIIYRKFSHFMKHMFVDIVSVGFIVLATRNIELEVMSYMEWFLKALPVGIIAAIVILIVNLVFYPEFIFEMCHIISRNTKNVWKEARTKNGKDK